MSRFKDFKPRMEAGGRESIVDKLGYVRSEDRIKRMLRAGILNAAASAGVFDGDVPDGLDPVVPPWRSKDFDIADGAQYLRSIVKRRDALLRKSAEEQRELLAAAQVKAAAQQAPEGQGASPLAGVGGQSPVLPPEAAPKASEKPFKGVQGGGVA